jgi:type I restriction-modification system DNA methylase subunit
MQFLLGRDGFERNLVYNTGIATYVWLLANKKPLHRKGKIQLIDATRWFKPLRRILEKRTVSCRRMTARTSAAPSLN